ncbi:MAG: HI0074 family nucleotidyltransferase substrate-binding subunit [Candidatus Caenarcaniphilales bacterium]|nr:HI0074 family nucleotidyltransferase substrate-binding subunit [Candidatus Caenarcaniphilales bacterium]
MNKSQLIKQVVQIILKNTKPERIYLYGSQAQGEASETSDIDIACDSPDTASDGQIKEEVAELETLIKIDVQNINRGDSRFQNRVKSTGKVLYSAGKKQRFEDSLYNLKNAFDRFSEIVIRKQKIKEAGYENIYLDLAIKRFEFTYEMTWKTIKRYLAFVGIEALSPRACFQEALSQKLIDEEEIWLEIIESRNLSSHLYNN